MLTAISSTTFSESRVLSALLLERRFRAHLVWRHRLVFDSRWGAPAPGRDAVATIYFALDGAFAVDGADAQGPVAYAVAASEYERVRQGGSWFRSWGDPSVTMDLMLAERDVRAPIGLRHGPLRLSAATWEALQGLADALATAQPMDALVRRLFAALVADGVVVDELAEAVVEEPASVTRLWDAMSPHVRALAPSVSLFELARAAGLSLRQLRRDVNTMTDTFALFGGNFRDSLLVLRLRLAVLLLSSRESTVGEVAMRVGYKSIEALARAFRDAGLPPPSEVRANVLYPREPTSTG
jgi:AraC-like DNA-binding protein